MTESFKQEQQDLRLAPLSHVLYSSTYKPILEKTMKNLATYTQLLTVQIKTKNKNKLEK